MSDLYILKVTSTLVSEYHIEADSEEEAHEKVYSSDYENKIDETVRHIETLDIDRLD